MNRRRERLKIYGIILTFGLIGGLGCLLAGRYPGEWLIARTNLPQLDDRMPGLPYHNETVTREVTYRQTPELEETTTTRNTTINEVAVTQADNDEFISRLRTHGAHTGTIQISLIWKNINDLDLSVKPPSGETIWYQHQTSRCKGWLDVDMNAGYNETDRPVENIVWEQGDAPNGNYRVYVHHYSNHGAADPTRYKVRVVVDGETKMFEGSTSEGDSKKMIYSFNYNPVSVSDAASESITPTQGETTSNPRTERIISERIERRFIQGPTKVDLRFWHAVLIVALWAAIISAGLALLLIGSQIIYKKQLLTSFPEFLRSTAGIIGGGFLAGAVGQILYGLMAQEWLNPEASRPLGWAVFGGLLGTAASICIPNLRRIPCILAGTIGGLAGGQLFETITRNTPDLAGRSIGIWTIGFMIGLTIIISSMNHGVPHYGYQTKTKTVKTGHTTSDHMWRE